MNKARYMYFDGTLMILGAYLKLMHPLVREHMRSASQVDVDCTLSDGGRQRITRRQRVPRTVSSLAVR